METRVYPTTVKEAVYGSLARQLRDFIGKGGVFGAKFIKSDGTVRSGSFRLGVQKYVKGMRSATEETDVERGVSAGDGQTTPTERVDPADHGNIVVFDMNKMGYRTIKVERLISITVRGETYTFERLP